jgi:hypothetical protein
MNCQYCNSTYDNKRMHQTSLTCQTNVANHYLLQRKNGDDSEFVTRESVIDNYNEFISESEFNCPQCSFEATDKDTMLQHEESCMGLKVIDVESVYKSLVCEDCGYEIEMKGQKMKPKYMMNAHKKKCHKIMVKKKRAYIKEHLSDATPEQVKEIFTILNNI